MINFGYVPEKVGRAQKWGKKMVTFQEEIRKDEKGLSCKNNIFWIQAVWIFETLWSSAIKNIECYLISHYFNLFFFFFNVIESIWLEEWRFFCILHIELEVALFHSIMIDEFTVLDNFSINSNFVDINIRSTVIFYSYPERGQLLFTYSSHDLCIVDIWAAENILLCWGEWIKSQRSKN